MSLNLSDVLPLFVFVTVVATAIILGPTVPQFQLASPTAAHEPPGQGVANVTLVSVPSSMALDQGRFGAGTYSITSEPTTVRIEGVRGNPYLEYILRVPELNYIDISYYALPDNSGNAIELTPKRTEISPTSVTTRIYGGKLEIRLQAENYRVLHEGNVTVRAM